MLEPNGKEGQAASHNELSPSPHTFMPDPIKVPDNPDVDELRGDQSILHAGVGRNFSIGEPIVFNGQRIALRVESAKLDDKTDIKIDIKRKDGQTNMLRGLPLVVHHIDDEPEHKIWRLHSRGLPPMEKINVCSQGVGAIYFGTLDENGELVVRDVEEIPGSYFLTIPEDKPNYPVSSAQEGGIITMPPVKEEIIVADSERYVEQKFNLANGSFNATMTDGILGRLRVNLKCSKEWEGKIVPITVTRRPTDEKHGGGQVETRKYYMVPQYSDLYKTNVAELQLQRLGRDEIALGLPVKPMESEQLTEQDAVLLRESIKHCATDFSLSSWQKFLEENPALPESLKTAIQEGIRADPA